VRLRRAGLDEGAAAAVAAGLGRGGGLEAVLLEVFASFAPAPPLPVRPGSLLVVVGAAAPSRRLGATLADEMGVDPAAVPFASRHAGALDLVAGPLLLRRSEDAAEMAPGWRRSRAAVVVVDAPLSGADRFWARAMITALRPTVVWGVVEATSKTQDIALWSEAVGGVDALAIENIESTVSRAATTGVGIPVARLNGLPATASRWAATIMDGLARQTDFDDRDVPAHATVGRAPDVMRAPAPIAG
jgi:hypothetical protein